MFFKSTAGASEAGHRLPRFGDKSPKNRLQAGQNSQTSGPVINGGLGASERTHEAQLDRDMRE